ncbi:MAG: hypothetical protein WC488_02630 [Candidatus Micrarchaeia archaeon]
MDGEIPSRVVGCVNIVCSDAREGGELYGAAKQIIAKEYLKRGIVVDYSRISSAGSFATADVISDTGRVIHRTLSILGKTYGKHLFWGVHDRKGDQNGKVYVNFEVSISTHGDVKIKNGAQIPSSIEDLEIVPGSPYNCGMLHASDVWMELVDLILKDKPAFKFFIPGNGLISMEMDTIEAILSILKPQYALQSDSIIDFAPSISNLLTHPIDQKSRLDRNLVSDKTLRSLDLRTSAAINNYPDYKYIRLDQDHATVGFMDDVYDFLEHIATMLPSNSPHIVGKKTKQQPVLGLIHTPYMTSSKASVLGDAIYSGLVHNIRDYCPGQIFTVSSMSAAQPYFGFDPYQITGIFYSVSHLGIRTYYLLGATREEADLIKQKVHNDPFVNFVMKKFGVKLVPRTIEEVSIRPPPVDQQVKEIIKEGIRTFKPRENSRLNQPVRKVQGIITL